MPTLTLPQLVAGRELAAAAVARLGDIAAAEVVVDARALASGTSSFAAQLVRSVILDGQAAELVLVGGPTDFVHEIRAAARTLQVNGRIRFADPDLPIAS